MNPNLAGQVIDNYQLIEVMGRGGMAVVYRARQLNIERNVAVKVMSAALAGSPDFIARFKREADLIAKLEHPHILPIYDYGQVGEYVYLVVRLMEGGSLDRRIRGKPLPLPDIEKLMTQIGGGLDYAHQHGIVHRDLKPNNVLLDNLGNAYLMDFGIAKIMQGTQMTATGTMMGTPAYMAPEQWKAENIDQRADIYSLGIILYELLTGDVPFHAETPHQLMFAHLEKEMPRASLKVPGLSPMLDEVVLKATSKKPEDRYQKATELTQHVVEAIKGQKEDLRGDLIPLTVRLERPPTTEPTSPPAPAKPIPEQAMRTVLDALPPTQTQMPQYTPPPPATSMPQYTPPPQTGMGQMPPQTGMGQAPYPPYQTSYPQSPTFPPPAGYTMQPVYTPKKKGPSVLGIVGSLLVLLILLGGAGGIILFALSQKDDKGGNDSTKSVLVDQSPSPATGSAEATGAATEGGTPENTATATQTATNTATATPETPQIADVPVLTAQSPMICPDTMISQLSVGMHARTTLIGRGTTNVRTNPDGDITTGIANGTEFNVIGGPDCTGGRFTWWQVQLKDGTKGWVAEGENNYFVEPWPTVDMTAGVLQVVDGITSIQVRSEATESSETVATLFPGDRVSWAGTLEQDGDYRWAKVTTYDNSEGYILFDGNFVRQVDPREVTAGIFVSKTVEVMPPGDGANLRQTFDTASTRVQTVDKGTKMEVIGGPEYADYFVWWQVRLEDGTEGWIADHPDWFEVAQ
ncbi:MAG: protein kinase [Chloroflexi bacterium]|nr:protein kinase [Chloroflexota bacterium]